MESLFDRPEFNASLFFPRPEFTQPPPDARDLRILVAPDVRLHARVHDRPDARAVVLLFHGNGEVVSDYDDYADQYARAGAALAVVDYRGYGMSEGTPTLRDSLADAHRVLDGVCELLGERPLIVMGRSLGGACAAELCQQSRPEVVGYVFESAPADLQGTVRRRGIRLTAPLPEADLAAFDPLPKLRRCATPALVIHGERDTLIPAAEASMTLDALAAKDKELALIPGRGHNDVAFHPRYWEALGRFVARVPVRNP